MTYQKVVIKDVAGKDKETTGLPDVFKVPIRPDLIHMVHRSMSKNRRQAYAVSESAGHQTSAESWGTGRAMARIPRVKGSGTQRAGQGAFGNMCRGGRMFAPTKVWRRWHRSISKNERRYAVVSALAATTIVSLVSARGHRLDNIPVIPLIVEDKLEEISRTKEAVSLLKALNVIDDVEKVSNNKKIRAGKGKLRGRKYKIRKGPLIIYKEDKGIIRGFRNIPGVELAQVDRLSLLDLAPGGHIGRLVIWSQSAFMELEKIFGSYSIMSSKKKGYMLPDTIISNPDINSIINSDIVQAVVRPICPQPVKVARISRKDALANSGLMAELEIPIE